LMKKELRQSKKTLTGHRALKEATMPGQFTLKPIFYILTVIID
jgi:hypothetical protein